MESKKQIEDSFFQTGYHDGGRLRREHDVGFQCSIEVWPHCDRVRLFYVEAWKEELQMMTKIS